MVRHVALLLLCAVAPGGDEDRHRLEQPLTSSRARQLREQGNRAWARALPHWETARSGEPVAPEVMVKAVADIEEAVLKLERSLQVEWETATNKVLGDAVVAWHALYPKLPPPPVPATEEEREKAAEERARVKRARLREARRFLLGYAAARRYRAQFRRCDRCDGRKELRSAFGDKRPCPVCKRAGHLVIRKGILKARWYPQSPLYRGTGRNISMVDRLLRSGGGDVKRLAPFLRSLAIEGKPEDHDTWVRFQTEARTHTEPGAKRLERVKASYVVYRAGKVWYLHDARADRKVLEVPGAEE